MADEKRKIEEIQAALPDWDFIRQLPETVSGFTLQRRGDIDGQILTLASYVNEALHCRLHLTYTRETFDYVPVKEIGLNVFRDIRYFCRDKEKFAAQMQKSLPGILDEVSRKTIVSMGYEAKDQNFDGWDYWRALPRQIGNYELFITPDRPVQFINGSFIFLDYSDFKRGNQLYLLYNGFRDEVFAEYKKDFVPLTALADWDINAEDCRKKKENEPPIKKLSVLSKRLDARLEAALKELENS